MKKSIDSTYKILDEIQHIRARPGMYVGSVTPTMSNEWVFNTSLKKMEKREIEYIPALIKIFSEILDNAIDESRRAPEVLDSIRVTFEDDGEIIVQDNGRGIPVEIHPQSGKYVAETVFSQLRAGSNFNDEEDAQLIGTHGIGSTATNILSSSFRVESCDGKKVLRQDFWNGMREKGDAVIKTDTKNRTKITFKPDYEFFKLPGLTEGNKLRMMKKVVDAAACNPNVKFYINSERVMVRDFDDYVALYTDDFVTDITPDWKVGISASDGFEHVSFVNSVETFQGGTHVMYVIMQIANELRAHIKKKHKVDIAPAQIREHLRVYISANINRPKFSSQTKENMISPVSDYKTSWEVPAKMISKIIKSTVIQNILDWAEAKARQEELKELRKLNKDVSKVNPKRVDKFDDAIEKNDRHNCEVFFTEGDCLDENTEIVTQGESTRAKLKNVNIGDFVLTHNNCFKKVKNKTNRLKECIKILLPEGKTITCSKEHRLFVYNRKLNCFGWADAETISSLQDDFYLVENEIISKGAGGDELIYKSQNSEGEIVLGFSSGQEWVSSPTHKWMVYQVDSNSFKLVMATEFNIGDMLMMRKY